MAAAQAKKSIMSTRFFTNLGEHTLFKKFQGVLLKKQHSLKTRDAEIARRICHAKNEVIRQPAINLQLARA